MNHTLEFPPHAYIPGKSDRHPDGYFDSVRNTVSVDMSVSALVECAAFKTGLAYMDSGFHWEAHEVLEPVWLALEAGTDEHRVIQACIQLSNARLKKLMGRNNATKRLCLIVRDLLGGIEPDVVMTVSVGRLISQATTLEDSL